MVCAWFSPFTHTAMPQLWTSNPELVPDFELLQQAVNPLWDVPEHRGMELFPSVPHCSSAPCCLSAHPHVCAGSWTAPSGQPKKGKTFYGVMLWEEQGCLLWLSSLVLEKYCIYHHLLRDEAKVSNRQVKCLSLTKGCFLLFLPPACSLEQGRL